MATAVSSVTSAPIPAQTVIPSASRQTTSASSVTDPFQTALAQASAAAKSAQARKDVTDATASAQAADQDQDKKIEDARAADAAADAAAALAALAAQTATPTNVPVSPQLAVTLPTGQTATDAQSETAPELTKGQTSLVTQSNPLFRQLVSEAAPQNNTRLPGSVTATTPPPPTTPTTPTTPPVPTTALPQTSSADAAAALLPVTPPTPPLAAAVAAVQPGQGQIVPAQAPIVPGALPTPPEAVLDGLPTPVVAPQAPIETTALPDVVVGDRPGTAGEQFAAIASTAASFSPAAAPAAPAAFAPVPAGTDLANSVALKNFTNFVPTQLAAREEQKSPSGDAKDTATSASPAPALGTAPAPNSVTAAQTPTPVRAPDPVAQVADGIITHAHVMTRGGTTEFQLRLDPPELGPVRIRLSSDGDGINGQVVVSNDAIRRMIESQLPELRQRLEAAGVNVQNFSVATDPGTGTGTGADTGSNAYPQDPLAAFTRPPAVVTALPPRLTGVPSAGTLDVMA